MGERSKRLTGNGVQKRKGGEAQAEGWGRAQERKVIGKKGVGVRVGIAQSAKDEEGQQGCAPEEMGEELEYDALNGKGGTEASE